MDTTFNLVSLSVIFHNTLKTIYDKLPVDNRLEVIRLVHARWAELHEEFARIDSTGSKLKQILIGHETDQAINAPLLAPPLFA